MKTTNLCTINGNVDPCCKQDACVTSGTVVVGEGNLDADWMIVGEAPSYHEQKTGRPFVGKAGKELDRILTRVGTDRSKFYITNAIKCRLTNDDGKDRAPTRSELEACTPILHRQVMAINPSRILLLGMTAVKALIPPSMRRGDHGAHLSMRDLRGRFFIVPVGDAMFSVMPTYHPSPRNLRLHPFIENDITFFVSPANL